MLLCEILSVNEMSIGQLHTVEAQIERFFRDLNIEVQWTRHFVARVSDGGREQDVSPEELAHAFAKLKRKYGQVLQHAHDNHERFVALLQDIGAKLNIVFDIEFQAGSSAYPHKYVLHGITIMRKRPSEFRSGVAGTKVLKVEGAEPNKKPKRKKKDKFQWRPQDEARARSIGRVWLATAADAT